MKQNHIFVISPHLYVAAKSYSEAKRIAMAQIDELQGEAIDNATMFGEDISGITGLSFSENPDGVKFEKILRKTWGLDFPAVEEQFTRRKGDGLAADDARVAMENDTIAKRESMHKHTGKRKDKR